MPSINELKDELEKINIERDETKKQKQDRRMLPLIWDRHIRQGIGYLFRYGHIKLDDLAEKLKIHIKDVEYVVRILEKTGLVVKSEKDSITITQEGDRIAKELGFEVQLQNQTDRLLSPYLIKDIEEKTDDFIKQIPPSQSLSLPMVFCPRFYTKYHRIYGAGI